MSLDFLLAGEFTEKDTVYAKSSFFSLLFVNYNAPHDCIVLRMLFQNIILIISLFFARIKYLSESSVNIFPAHVAFVGADHELLGR